MYIFSLEPQKVDFVNTKFRKIHTPIPNPETLQIIQNCLECEPFSMNDQLPVVWDRAEGFQVFDKSENCWIDLTSTIFVTNIGHAHPKVCDAIIQTVNQKLLNAYYYQTEQRLNLSKLLIEITPPHLNKVLLLSTGSEATEAALKMVRLYGSRIHPDKTVVVAFEGAFHGKTMGSQTLGGKPSGKQWIKYHHPEIVHLPYPYPWILNECKMSGKEFFYHSLKKLEEQGVYLKNIAAFFAEPYQGWCAVFFPKDYMQTLREWATENQSLLGFDEVQAGFGRTGKMFGFEHLAVDPDLIWCGKAISSSLPVSAVIGRESILNADLSLNSTHGGNPVGAAASYASIRAIIDEDLLSESTRKGELIQKELLQWQRERPEIVSEIFGVGMLWGVLIRNPETQELDVTLVDKLIEKAMQKGVLSIRTCCGTIKLGPPLITPDEALLEAIQVLKSCLNELI